MQKEYIELLISMFVKQHTSIRYKEIHLPGQETEILKGVRIMLEHVVRK